MYIVGPNGLVVSVTADNRLSSFAVSEIYLHAMTRAGRAWSLTGTYTASTTDSPFFWFQNNDTSDIMFHAIVVASPSAGIATLEYGRSWSAGGTARTTVAQLQTLSAQVPTISTYGGAVLTLTGTNTDVVTQRCGVDQNVDLLLRQESFQVFPGGTMALRFKADAGTPTLTYALMLHGSEPWGD